MREGERKGKERKKGKKVVGYVDKIRV